MTASAPSPVWVYMPWHQTTYKLPAEDAYTALRTARNRNIITQTEQDAFRAFRVGVAGLSVGAAAMQALVQSGGPRDISIADYDTLEFTNLNRLRASAADVGTLKIDIVARDTWELDPFAQLHRYPDGITGETVEPFLADPPRDVCIDALDSIDAKVRLRQTARQHGIPVIMATDNGDDVLLDVERFDEEHDRPLFHGNVDEHVLQQVGALSRAEWIEVTNHILKPDMLTQRMQSSLLEIGSTISGIPQLGTTAQVAGASVAFAVRQIATHAAMPSGRYIVSLEHSLTTDYMSDAARRERAQHTDYFRRMMGTNA